MSQKSQSTLSIWLQALRLFSLPATVVPVLVGILMTLVFYEGSTDWFLLPLILIGTPLFQLAGNLISDYYDFNHKVDQKDTFGSSKVLVNGLLPAKSILRLGVTFTVILFLIGMVLVYFRGWELLVIGGIGLLGVFFYTTMKYRALGDLEIFILFGPLMTFGTFFALTGSHELLTPILLVSIPVGFLVTAILHANNLRDIKFDQRVNIKTLASVLGVQSSKNYYQFLIIGAYVAVVLLIMVQILPYWSLLVFVSLPLAIKNIKTINTAHVDQPDLISMSDATTAQLHLIFGLLLSLSLLLEFFFLLLSGGN